MIVGLNDSPIRVYFVNALLGPVTVLLEYLDRAFSICGYLLFYNLLILHPILLSFRRDDLLCLIPLHSNFHLVPLCCLCDIGGNS